jgi:hypothetical protein
MGSNKGEPHATCDYCGKNEFRYDCADWEMQHIHLQARDVDFLTCEKCKKLSPMSWLEKIRKPADESETK